MKTKLKPLLFIKAAKELDKRDCQSTRGCCRALDQALYDVWGPFSQQADDYHRTFRRLLQPEDVKGNLWWYSNKLRGVPNEPENIRNARIIGLLLCAELVRDGWSVEDFQSWA